MGGETIALIKGTFVASLEAAWFCARVTFFLLKPRDSADHAYECKSHTLEAIALALPFFCSPEKLVGQEVLIMTDGGHWLWLGLPESCQQQSDPSTS
jgi:hypothetical protein